MMLEEPLASIVFPLIHSPSSLLTTCFLVKVFVFSLRMVTFHDGLEPNTIYFAITSGVGTDQIKSVRHLTMPSMVTLTINNKGGILSVESRVSDKTSGDIGHPIQYDANEAQWYITVGTASTDNTSILH